MMGRYSSRSFLVGAQLRKRAVTSPSGLSAASAGGTSHSKSVATHVDGENGAALELGGGAGDGAGPKGAGASVAGDGPGRAGEGTVGEGVGDGVGDGVGGEGADGSGALDGGSSCDGAPSPPSAAG